MKVKICPYCDTDIPAWEIRCPSCGELYWVPEQIIQSEEIENFKKKEVEKGCFSLFFLPVLLAVATSLLVLAAGYFVNLVIHFESNQVTIAWILSSSVLGLVIFRLFLKIKKKTKKPE